MNLPSSQKQPKPPSGHRVIIETLIPLLLAGFGLIAAGILLEHAADHAILFHRLPDMLIMVPTLVGLKGNLEMTLSSRLSTLSNLGFMEKRRDVARIALANIALVQCQAIVVSAISLIPICLISPRLLVTIDGLLENLCMMAAAIATASIASLLLSTLMILLVVIARRFKLNPDNITSPVASSLGDFSTLFILVHLGKYILHLFDNNFILLIITLAVFMFIAILGAIFASTDQFTKEVLRNGFWPIIFAMLITTGSGFVLKTAIESFSSLAAFQPLINGVGGNLVAVQASRISTQLHLDRKNDNKNTVKCIHYYINPLVAFFYKSDEARAAQMLIAMSIPCNLLFLQIIFFLGSSGFHNSLVFTVGYLTASFIQVSILLYICQILVRLMWKMRIDPDNSAIPFLTAIGDLIGSLALIATFILINPEHQ